MPAQTRRPEIMDEDQLMKEVLDKFVNCHEQTYEEFLSTFTHLSRGQQPVQNSLAEELSRSTSQLVSYSLERGFYLTETMNDNVAKRGAHGTDSSENIFTAEKLTHKNESNGHHFRNTAIFPNTSSECSEDDQIVIDEGRQVGSSLYGDMTWAGKVKVDNFLNLEDLDMEEEGKPQVNKDWVLLPGEVEQGISASVPAYVPSVDLPLTSEVKPKPTMGRTLNQTEEIFGDEVQPFFLDEEFDYDNVTLTPKFTAGEIATIQELAKQKRADANPDFCEPHD